MITWVLECDVFPDNAQRLSESACQAGHEVIKWQDDWLFRRKFPNPAHTSCVFHGSLGNAAQIQDLTHWSPGAFCTVANFHCSNWYSSVAEWLLQKEYSFTTVKDLVDDPKGICAPLSEQGSIFVRPDSPLKPFSGRLLKVDEISMRSLDHGLYYEDENLPIVICKPTTVDQEWRFVVAQKLVVAGSEYNPTGRKEGQMVNCGLPWDFAQSIANILPNPDLVYVMDICQSDGNYALLELNPFSGADLYACDRNAIVRAVAEAIGSRE